MTKPNPQPRLKTIADMSIPDLERELVRCGKALSNKQLNPMSVTHYRRRREMVESEIKDRKSHR